MCPMRSSRGSRPLRWRVQDFFGGPWGRPAVLAIGASVLLGVTYPMLFRPYQGRPEIRMVEREGRLVRTERGGVVVQTAIRCEAASTSIFRDFSRAGASASDPVRICTETGRTKVFTMALFLLLMLVVTGTALRIQANARRAARAAVKLGESRVESRR